MAAPTDARFPAPANAPPGAVYESRPAGFHISVRSRVPQSWLAAPLSLLWIAVAVYAFVIAPRRPDDAASNMLIVAAFAALIGIPVLVSALFHALGRITVTCDGAAAAVRDHLGPSAGPWGSSRPFSWNALTRVREVELRGRLTRGPAIELDLSAARADRRLYFGKGLPDDARRFLIEALEIELARNRRHGPLGLDA